MQVTGKVVVVTGGANGIGRALCEAFHRAGAAKVIVADLDIHGARAVAAAIDGAAFKCDVAQEKDFEWPEAELREPVRPQPNRHPRIARR